MSAVLLEAEHISKRYDDVAVVDSVSLQVEAGRILTIIGPNLLSQITDLISNALQAEIDLAARFGLAALDHRDLG